jgi:hypothetical protein
MLTRKVLFGAFIVNLVLLLAELGASRFIKTHKNTSGIVFLSYKLLFTISVMTLLAGLYSTRKRPRTTSLSLGIVTYLISIYGFRWPELFDKITPLELVNMVSFPLLFLAASFFFFKKRQLDVAKALSFSVLCCFVNSLVVYLLHIYLLWDFL